MLHALLDRPMPAQRPIGGFGLVEQDRADSAAIATDQPGGELTDRTALLDQRT